MKLSKSILKKLTVWEWGLIADTLIDYYNCDLDLVYDFIDNQAWKDLDLTLFESKDDPKRYGRGVFVVESTGRKIEKREAAE